MYNLSKDLILSILLLSGGNSLMRQKRTYSPFSTCGLGELTNRGLEHSHGMGGTEIDVRSNQHLNNLNPATPDTSKTKGFDLSESFDLSVLFNWKNKLLVASGFSTEKWGDATLKETISSISTSNWFSAGDEYTPNKRSQSHLDRMYYIVDFQHFEDYTQVDNYQMKYFGISFGIVLPISRINTSVNLSLGLGNAFLFLNVLCNG
jgi:hypothetical protein